MTWRVNPVQLQTIGRRRRVESVVRVGSAVVGACRSVRACRTSVLRRVFKQSNTHKFTWFGNLPTPRSYWFVLIKLSNNTNNKTRRRKTSLLNSTLSVFSSSLRSSHSNSPALHWAYIYIELGVKGINHAMIYAHRLCPPPCVKWEIRYSHLYMVGHCLSPLTNSILERKPIGGLLNYFKVPKGIYWTQLRPVLLVSRLARWYYWATFLERD